MLTTVQLLVKVYKGGGGSVEQHIIVQQGKD